jgi:hypothetical protein
MSRSQTDSIRGFILDCVAESPRSIARQVAEAYGISRQAANRHLDALVEDGVLDQSGLTRSREYHLRRQSLLNREIRVTPVLNPERLWDDHIAPVVARDPAPVRDLCRGAFGEMIRNVIQHAHAGWIKVAFEMTARHIEVSVEDDGRGLFHRVAELTRVPDAKAAAALMLRHATARTPGVPAFQLLLLARSFEWFEVASGGIGLTYFASADTWGIENAASPTAGTRVAMRLCRAEKVRGAARVQAAG